MLSATRVDCKLEKGFTFSSEFLNSIDLDYHLKMSIVSGLINEFHGASSYINDRPDPGQATVSLAIRTQTREEHLDLEMLVSQQVPRLPVAMNENRDFHDPVATHIVTGVFYGTETYCVLAQDFDGSEADEETRKEVTQNLSNIAMKWISKLTDFGNLEQFQQTLNKTEKYQLARIKCRMYSDLRVDSLREYSVFDAYGRSLELLKTMCSKEIGNSNAVPIAILLCPLKFLVDPAKRSALKFGYRDIDDSLASRFDLLFDDWKRIGIKAEKICAANEGSPDCSKLREFVGAISKYKEVLQMKLTRTVVNARKSVIYSDDSDVKSAFNIAETHPLFGPSKLKEWLNFKQAELDMASRMISGTGAGVTFLINREQLKEQLSSSKKFTVVLFVPPLDGKTRPILYAMKKSSDTCIEYYTSSDEEEEQAEVAKQQQPWHVVHTKRQLILDKIHELAQHVEKNRHLENRTQFIVTFGENQRAFGFNYSVYEGENLLKNNLRRLPGPPNGLRIHRPISRKAKKARKSTSTVRVNWEYEPLGYPCRFLVEYRLKNGSDTWIQRRTIKPDETQLSITFKTDSTLEIRVAADTCIGRSDFSDVIDTDSLLVAGAASSLSSKEKTDRSLLHTPINVKVKSVTRTTAELVRTLPPGNLYLCTRILYWKKAEKRPIADEINIDFDETSCLLEDLEPETTYVFNMATIADNFSNSSCPSENIEFTTLAKDLRFAETLLERCKNIGNNNGLDLYSVPLPKLNGQPTKADRFMFGAPDVNKSRMHRTILLVGTTSSGKTSLINAMANYIFDVQLDDPFRFQLLDPRLDYHTRCVTMYDIHYAKGFLIDYSLTIIDTPNFFENNPPKNPQTAELIRKFFDDKEGLQKVDLVGFVMDSSVPHLTPTQLYIYCTLITIFGIDIKGKVNFLFDGANSQKPLSFTAIAKAGLTIGEPLQHKFDSPAVFRSSGRFNELDVPDFLENFKSFFSSLALTKTKIVSLSKQKLDEAKRLEAVVRGLHKRLKTDMGIFGEIREIFVRHWSRNDEFEMERTHSQRVALPYGEYVTNCSKCLITCHLVCGIKGDEKFDCDVMDHSMPEETRKCRVCPEQCLWSMHRNESARWDYAPKKIRTTLEAIKQKYDAARSETLSWLEFREVQEAEILSEEEGIMKLMETILSFIERLCRVTKHLEGNSKSPCVDVSNDISYLISQLIRFEKKDERKGFNDRIDALIKLDRIADSNERGLLGCNDEERWVIILERFARRHQESLQFEEESEDEDSEENSEEGETDEENEEEDTD